MTRVIHFEEREFPIWTRYVRDHRPEDIVIGVEADGTIVASLVLDMPPVVWSRLLGDRSAEIGAVGVDRSRRNLGLGTALVTRACEILRDRDVEVASLRWLYRVNFYSRVGFRVWKQYAMCGKEFPVKNDSGTPKNHPFDCGHESGPRTTI